MLLKEIRNVLNREVPEKYAESWDHVGLVVGDENQDIKKVLVALDADDRAVEKAVEIEADLIVTHHPLLFHPLEHVTEQNFIGRRVRTMVKHNIAYYAMHTNFDKVGMADLNARELKLVNPKVLSVTDETEGGPMGFGRIGGLEKAETLAEFAGFVKDTYRLDEIRVYGDPDAQITCAAVASGSGKSSIPDAIEKGAQVIVTGDVDYHTAIDANAQGIFVIDAGHYGTEFGFIHYMADRMKEWFPDLEILEQDIRQPYHIL